MAAAGLTYNTERLAGKLQPPSPSSIPTAATSGPDPHYILHTKHYDSHYFLKRIKAYYIMNNCSPFLVAAIKGQ